MATRTEAAALVDYIEGIVAREEREEAARAHPLATGVQVESGQRKRPGKPGKAR